MEIPGNSLVEASFAFYWFLQADKFLRFSERKVHSFISFSKYRPNIRVSPTASLSHSCSRCGRTCRLPSGTIGELRFSIFKEVNKLSAHIEAFNVR